MKVSVNLGIALPWMRSAIGKQSASLSTTGIVAQLTAALIFGLAALPASAITILYDNTNPGLAPGGWTIGSSMGLGQAMRFRPLNSGSVGQIRMPMVTGDVYSERRFWIARYADQPSVDGESLPTPGALLQRIEHVIPQQVSELMTITDFAGSAFLDASSSYWLAIEPITVDTPMAWMQNSLGRRGLRGLVSGLPGSTAPWTVYSGQTLGAFAITSAVVPLPTAGWFLVSALGLMTGIRRRVVVSPGAHPS